MHSGYEITYPQKHQVSSASCIYVFVHVCLLIKIINGKEVTSLRERMTWEPYQGQREEKLEGLQGGEGRNQ